jgi:hypothetical protein
MTECVCPPGKPAPPTAADLLVVSGDLNLDSGNARARRHRYGSCRPRRGRLLPSRASLLKSVPPLAQPHALRRWACTGRPTPYGVGLVPGTLRLTALGLYESPARESRPAVRPRANRLLLPSGTALFPLFGAVLAGKEGAVRVVCQSERRGPGRRPSNRSFGRVRWCHG